MQLEAKTRGNSSPQGKQRVYFCCHPADFSVFFPRVSEEILAKQNCAVWYGNTDAPRDEAFLDNLKEMQLFVMPVTSRLLYTENYALGAEFPFAVAHHIPVLPLMQEKGLETAFNEVCGNLQFLDKYQTDPTAIPYEEKLDKFLSGVLVGDELAKKVRAAFDAYVFLSYRKKDRRHAQELMRLIHKNPFCRDIAIWYDEFLTPGENFNDAIQEALEKSGLFVLTVTPNLINEPNYIQQVEYPMALEQGKTVVPAEMVSTDADKLADKYPGIPPVADAHDDAVLSAALLEAVQKLAIEENDHSPEHNFFIGLAYLNGIDVEVDHSRALELITGAAEAGLAEAAKKLIEIYRDGIGVKRDYEEAIRWQEKLVAIREKDYATCEEEKKSDVLLSLEDLFSDDDDFTQAFLLGELFWCLLESGRFYCEMERVDLAKKAYQKALRYLEEYPYDKTTEKMQSRFFSCYKNLGDAYRQTGDVDTAEAYYEKSRQMVEANAKYDQENYSRNLAVIHNRLGLCCLNKGDWAKARFYHTKQLEQDEALAKKTGTVPARRNLATACVNLGDVCESEKDLDAARGYYQRACDISMELVAEAVDDTDLLDLTSCYFRLGDIEKSQKRYDEAYAYYEKGIAIREQVAEKSGTVQNRHTLAIGYIAMANLLFIKKEWAAAQRYRERALALYLVLVEEVKTAELRESLRICCDSLRKIHGKQGTVAEYCTTLAAVVAVYERLAQALETPQMQWELSVVYLKLGNACEDSEDYVAATIWYEQALSIRRRLANELASLRDQQAVTRCLRYLARVCKKRRDYTAAKGYYIDCLSVLVSVEEKGDADDTYNVYRDLYDCYNWLAGVCSKLDQTDEAQRYRCEADALREKAWVTSLDSLDDLFADD